MTPLGQLSFKICGGVPEACCAVVDIANGDGMNEVLILLINQGLLYINP